ncbi:MAG: histidine phosphatase family protein [Clostridiales bacterium]|nr:histidine phosphatase family protein [Clostridiales bacterium]
MAQYDRRRAHINFASTPGTPLLFCTPAQVTALLSEARKPVFLVRHGITAWNKQMRLQGREDIPLSEEGREQALHCAAFIGKALPQNRLQLQRVYTSPLMRAYDTASYISDCLGLGKPVVEEGLIERDYGALSGLTPDKKKELYPTPADYPKDVESIPSAAKRMKRTLAEMCSASGDEAIVAVTHGGVMNALFSSLTGGRAGLGPNITQNCAVAMVAVGKYDIIPLSFNMTARVFPEYVGEIDFPMSV